MSRTIDERIVQMTFDNQDFERGAKQTIDTLGRLKDASNSNAYGQGLAAISESAKKINLTPLINGFNSVGNSVSLLETIATGALLRLGSKVTDFGINLVKSLSINQIASGWQKYAEAIQSEQTIMSAVAGKTNPTTGEIYDIDSITDRISKLQWYTDETSYNISQMTNAIGSFTSSGIDLDVATQAILGISNACADAGVSTSKAESAFTAFSRAIGTGNMTLGVWNMQMKTSGLTNSERFKQSLIDAAVEVGNLTKVSEGLYKTTKKAGGTAGLEVSVSDISSAFNSGKWANSEVMLKALNSYSDTVDRIYEMASNGEVDTASEAIAQLTKEYQNAGQEIPKSLEAFRRAQEAISFEQAIQSVKDAVSSKWSQTFELIFGNYEEAKSLWTTLANEMWEWFASGGDERNKLLEQWHEGVSDFQKQLDAGKIDIDVYKQKIKGLTESDPVAKALTSEQNQAKLYSAMLTRDASKIGEAVSEVYKEYGKLTDVPNIEYVGGEKAIIAILEERDKLLKSEEDEIKRLKIIADYNEKIGELIKNNPHYEETATTVSTGAMKDSNKRLEVYQKLSDAMKLDNPSETIDELLKDADSLKIITDLLGSDKISSSSIISELSNLSVASNLEKEQKSIEGLFSAIEEGDLDTMISLWKDNYQVFYKAFGKEIPQKIKDLQKDINGLTEDDSYLSKIKELKENLSDATGKSKKDIEKQISFYEGLNEAIKSDSISDYYKENKKTFDSLFSGSTEYESIMKEINKINKDDNLTQTEKTFALGKQYEYLEKLVKSQSNITKLTEKQKELEKELIDYFIEGKSGYDIFIKTIETVLGNITNMVSTIKTAFQSVFPSMTPVGLIDLTQSFSDFIDRISLSEEQLEKVGSFFERIFTIGKNVLSILNPIWSLLNVIYSNFITPLMIRFKPIFEDILKIFENVSEYIKQTADSLNNNMGPVQRFFGDLMTTFEPLIRTIQKVIHWVEEFTASWLNVTETITEDGSEEVVNDSIFSKILKVVKKAFELIEQIVTGSKPLIDFIKDTLGGVFQYLGEVLKNIFEVIDDVLGDNSFNVVGFAGVIAAIQQIFAMKWAGENVANKFDIFGWIIKAFGNFGEALAKIPELISNIGDRLYDISDAIGAFWNKSFAESLKNIGYGMLAISVAVLILASIKEDALYRALGAIAAIGMIITAMVKLLGMIKTSISSAANQGEKKGGFFSSLFSIFDVYGLNQFATMMRNLDIAATILSISIGMVIIASAMKIISTIPKEQFGQSLVALLMMMGAIFAFIAGIQGLEKKSVSVKKKGLITGGSAKSETGTVLKGVGKVVEKIAFGLLILSAALKVVSTIPTDQLVFGVIALTWMLAAIGVLVSSLSKIEMSKKVRNPLKDAGKVIEQVAFGMLIVAAALKVVSTIGDPGTLVNSIAALSFMLLAVGVFMSSMAKVESGLKDGKSLIKIASSILILSIAIGAITGAIAVMSMIPLGALTKGVAFLGIALAEIWLFCKAMSDSKKGTTDLMGIAAAMVVFSSSLVILSLALGMISALSTDSLIQAMLGIAGTMFVIGTVVAIFSNPAIIKGILAFSAAFLAIGAAVMMTGIGISQLVPLLMLLSTQTEDVSHAIQLTLITVFETMLGIIPDFIIALVDAILEFVGLLIIGFAEKVPELLDGLANLLNTLAEGLKEKGGALGAALGNLAAALIEAIVTALYEAGKALLGGLWDWIIGDSGLDGEALTQQVAVKMGTAGAEGGDALTASLHDTLEQQNQDYISNLAERPADAYLSGFNEYLEANGSSVEGPAKSIGDIAADAMENDSGASSAAYNTVAGFTSFINSAGAHGMVSNAFSGIGYVGIKALKDALGIKSPSKVMAEQGMYSVLGLVNGVYENIDSVDEAGTDTANALLNAMQLAADNAESILEDDLNPVITPILDLTNLEENSGAISSLLNNGTSYKAALAVQSASANANNQNGAIKPLSVNVSFTINEAGRDLTEEDFTRFGRQIANIVNQELGGAI